MGIGSLLKNKNSSIKRLLKQSIGNSKGKKNFYLLDTCVMIDSPESPYIFGIPVFINHLTMDWGQNLQHRTSILYIVSRCSKTWPISNLVSWSHNF